MNSSPNSRAFDPVKLGIVLLSILLVLDALVSIRATRTLAKSSQWVEHTRAVETETEEIGSLIKDVETGQRGFLLTGKDSYLEPYNNGIRELPERLARFEKLTSDNPNQAANLANLRRLIDQRIGICTNSIDLYREGKQSESLAIVNSDNGKKVMDQIRILLGQMRAEEQKLLEGREFAKHRSSVLAFWTLGISSAIGILALWLFGTSITREMRARAAAAEAIRERQEWLDTTIRSIGDAVIATRPVR